MKKNEAKRDQPPAGEIADQLRAELEKIVASPEFKGSKRCQTFLRYVVNKTLAGQGSDLKERTLAVELYGRPPGADLEHDSAVRVCARHVRERLARYYASASGAAARWRIELPAGSYEPSFIPAVQESGGEASARPERARLGWRFLTVALAAASLGSLLLWRFLPSSSSPIDQFWGPALSARRAAILLAQPPSGGAPGGEPARFQAAAAAELFHLFRSRNCSVNIRSMEEEKSDEKLRDACVIIGPPAHGNIARWLDDAPFRALLGAGWNLQFLPEEKEEWISDLQQKASNVSVIYRIPGAPGRPFSVVFGGLSPAATCAAARLAANPQLLGRFLQALPQEWSRNAVAAAVFFPEGSEARFQLVKARLWQPRPPAP